MVFADKVIDKSGSPDVWITEDLNQDPDDRAAESIRVVWKQIRMNFCLVRVVAVAVDRIQDGCKSGRTHNIPESVPEDHIDDLDMQVQLDLIDTNDTETRLVFPQFDIERNVKPDPVDPEEAREGDLDV
jgi:hypothetical protein